MLRPRSLVMAGVLTLAIVLAAGQVSCQSSANCDCNGYNQQVVEDVVGANAVVHYDGLPLGSGIAYRKNGKLYVLTASHVIEDEEEIKSRTWCFPSNFVELDVIPSFEICPEEPSQGKTWGTKEIKVTLFNGRLESPISSEKCKMIFNDPEYDLCILEVEEKSPVTPLVKGCLFDYKTPRMGVPVYIVGNPQGDYMTITRGIIGNNHRSRESLSEHVPFFYQTDADAAPGSSGGGLYRADTGACVGVVVMLNCRNMQVYSVPTKFLMETLMRHNQLDLLPPST
jgi:S1-C subfamily serine protease